MQMIANMPDWTQRILLTLMSILGSAVSFSTIATKIGRIDDPSDSGSGARKTRRNCGLLPGEDAHMHTYVSRHISRPSPSGDSLSACAARRSRDHPRSLICSSTLCLTFPESTRRPHLKPGCQRKQHQARYLASLHRLTFTKTTNAARPNCPGFESESGVLTLRMICGVDTPTTAKYDP